MSFDANGIYHLVRMHVKPTSEWQPPDASARGSKASPALLASSQADRGRGWQGRGLRRRTSFRATGAALTRCDVMCIGGGGHVAGCPIPHCTTMYCTPALQDVADQQAKLAERREQQLQALRDALGSREGELQDAQAEMRLLRMQVCAYACVRVRACNGPSAYV